MTVANAANTVTPEITGLNNCNICITQSQPYMYCPDGSCVSFATGTCVTSGPIFTAQTGCRAFTTCNTGNHGLIVIGESDTLMP